MSAIAPRVLKFLDDHGPQTRAELQRSWELGRTLDNIMRNAESKNYVRHVMKPFCRRRAYQITDLGRAYVWHHLGE